MRSGAETVLVDTGIGPDPPARFASRTGTLPASLADLGIRVEEVTTVVLTHLHFDHVGWAVSPDASSPTFANARYLVDRADWTHWESSRHPDRADHERAFRKRAFPLEELEVLQLIEGEVQVADGVRTLPTPGHTHGHQSVLLESGGERGIVTGDVFHSVLQFAEPGRSHRTSHAGTANTPWAVSTSTASASGRPWSLPPLRVCTTQSHGRSAGAGPSGTVTCAAGPDASRLLASSTV